jgi:mannitol-specific phosphotransferase system IIBC component
MKTKLLTVVCVIVISLCSVNTGRASEAEPGAILCDVAIVRPGCFVATVVCSVVFIVALPIAVISRSVKQTADTLVVQPAQATFTRPLGDFSTLE